MRILNGSFCFLLTRRIVSKINLQRFMVEFYRNMDLVSKLLDFSSVFELFGLKTCCIGFVHVIFVVLESFGIIKNLPACRPLDTQLMTLK
jgi:hypothetical protein